MAKKLEQCEKCAINCPQNIKQVKLNKGRILFDECMDFTPKKTNADCIRSMSDEELAKFLEQFGTFNQPCNLSPGKPLKWLQSEVEEK